MTSSVITAIDLQTSPTVVLSRNDFRTKIVLMTHSSPCYIKLGVGCANNDYSYKMTTNMIWELDNYVGWVTGCSMSGVSPIIVSEIF